MRFITFVALACTVHYAQAAMSLAACNADTNGKTEWHGLVEYKCVFSADASGVSTKVALVSCRTPASKTVLKPGKDVRDGDFHYECTGNDKQLAVAVAYCYMPGADGADLQVGESVKADGGIYECKEVENKGVKSITRTFVKETLMCEIDGKKLKINEKFYPDETTVLQCYNNGGKADMRAVGCKLPNKSQLGLYQLRDESMCQVKAGDKLRCELVLRADTCKRNGVDKKVNTNWEEKDGEYRCQYSNLNALKKDHTIELKTEVIYNRCIVKVDGKNQYINRHRVSKISNGKYYWCKGTKPAGSKDYSWMATEMTDASKFTCEGGIAANARKTEDDKITYGCSFYNGKLNRYQHSCVADTGKAIYKNQKIDMGTYGWTCVKVGGLYVSRKMTAVEYKALMAKSGNAVSASGGFGAGVEGYDENKPTEPKCGEGFRLNGPKTVCVDVDECAEKTDDCEDNERCMNTEGKHVCLCLAGQVRVAETDVCETLTCPCLGLTGPARDQPKKGSKGKGKGRNKSDKSDKDGSKGLKVKTGGKGLKKGVKAEKDEEKVASVKTGKGQNKRDKSDKDGSKGLKVKSGGKGLNKGAKVEKDGKNVASGNAGKGQNKRDKSDKDGSKGLKVKSGGKGLNKGVKVEKDEKNVASGNTGKGQNKRDKSDKDGSKGLKVKSGGKGLNKGVKVEKDGKNVASGNAGKGQNKRDKSAKDESKGLKVKSGGKGLKKGVKVEKDGKNVGKMMKH